MIAFAEAGAIRSDAVTRARAFLRGDVLRGTLTKAGVERVGSRSLHRLEVRTRQRSLRIRQRDALVSLADARLRFEVTRVGRRGQWTVFSLEITAGMRSVGCPQPGVALELGPEGPDRDQRRRERKQMADRLADAPWTHTTNYPAMQPRAGERPPDFVGDVENLK